MRGPGERPHYGRALVGAAVASVAVPVSVLVVGTTEDVPVGVLVVGTTEDVPVGEALLGVVLILPIQLMRVAVLYRAGPEMSSAGAWATLVLAVVATVGGDVVILTDDSSTAALGFLFFPPLIAGGVFAAHVADAAARFAVRALTKRG